MQRVLIPEAQRIWEANDGRVPGKRWGPYLAERQWGTVREDDSTNGDAWSYFSHDQARSRAYRWGEDGLAAISDDRQRLCFALALWNGVVPILKQRAFGLTNAEGNHGEDVKDYYFHLDATPTSSLLRSLYKYPQRAFPYAELVQNNAARGRHEMEYELLLSPDYLHPNGQLPAYEWNFSDVNPPVHAFAVEMVYRTQKELRGHGDREFLKRSFLQLLVNHTWWVNRKDTEGNNLFEGGFLGLDNIGVFDRSAPMPTGGTLEQADGTAWMARYSLTMFRLAAELAEDDPVYETMAVKLSEHFLWICSAMNRVGPNQVSLWDEEDGFLYDVLRMPDGTSVPLKVRSMVGLLALAACEVIEPDQIDRLPGLAERIRTFHEHYPELVDQVAALRTPGWAAGGCSRRLMRPSCTGCWHGCSTRTSSSAPTGCGPCRAITPTSPTGSGSTATSTGSTTNLPSPPRACSAGTRTGAARCGSR